MSKPATMTLGQKIRAARLERGLTQDQLAAGHFSKTYVSALELGRIRPSVKALAYLADQLDLPVSYLLGEDQGELGRDQGLLDLATLRYDLLLGDPAAARARFAQMDSSSLDQRHREELHLLEVELCLAEDRPIEAQRLLNEMLVTPRRPLEPRLSTYADHLAACTSLALGQPGIAAQIAGRALTALRGSEVSDLYLELSILVTLMKANAGTSTAEALAQRSEIERLAEQASDPLRVAALHYQMATGNPGTVRWAEVQQHLHYAAGLVEPGANSSIAQAAARQLAALYLADADSETAAYYLDAALHYARLGRNSDQIAPAALYFARFHLNAGHLTEAEHLLDEAKRQAVPGDTLAGEVLILRARLWVEQGEREAADRAFQEAIAMLERAQVRAAMGDAYFYYGQALGRWGQMDDSARYLELAFATTNLPQN